MAADKQFSLPVCCVIWPPEHNLGELQCSIPAHWTVARSTLSFLQDHLGQSLFTNKTESQETAVMDLHQHGYFRLKSIRRLVNAVHPIAIARPSQEAGQWLAIPHLLLSTLTPSVRSIASVKMTNSATLPVRHWTPSCMGSRLVIRLSSFPDKSPKLKNRRANHRYRTRYLHSSDGSSLSTSSRYKGSHLLKSVSHI